MNAVSFRPARELRAPMDDMIQSYGLFPVVAALIRAAFRRKKTRPPPIRLADLSDHLRRDIGLAPRERGPRDWDPF